MLLGKKISEELGVSKRLFELPRGDSVHHLDGFSILSNLLVHPKLPFPAGKSSTPARQAANLPNTL